MTESTTGAPSDDSQRRSERRLALWLGLGMSAAIAALTWRVIERVTQGDAGAPARPDAELAAQVSLFWGGGAARRWNGELSVAATAEPSGAVAWVFLSDFESDDRLLPGAGFPAPAQRVPADWRPTQARDVVGTAPALGARIEGSTAGEADGLVLGLTTLDAELALELDGVMLRTQIAALLDAPRIVAADESGNVLMAQAIDLRRDAPLSAPHGEAHAWRTSLHTHSAFSTNEHPIDSTVASLRPFARTVFWTDHNTGDDRHVLAGDFEDRALAERVWFPVTVDAQLVETGLTSDAASGDAAFRLVAEASGSEPGRAWIALHRGRGAGEFNIALAMRPELRWSWKSVAAGGAFVDVQLHSGRRLRYVSEPAPPFATQDAPDAVIELPFDGPSWANFERDIAADVERELGAMTTDGLRRISLGVLCAPNGSPGEALFDDIHLELPTPDEAVRLQQRVLDEYSELRSFVALEQSAWLGPDDWGALYPHLTAYVPTGAPELFVQGSYDEAPSATERARFVRAVQAAGGAVGAHHLQLQRHYEALLSAGGLGIDLFEVGGAWHTVPRYVTPSELRWRDALGYPEQPEDELFPLLVRWDRATARGLLLAIYGAPDLHERFERPNGGWLNRWLTSIVSPEGTSGALLAALRSGQATAQEWRSEAVLTLALDGLPATGKVVVTDRPSHTLSVRVSGAIAGSRLRWIRGPLVRARANSEDAEPEPPAVLGVVAVDTTDFTTSIELETTDAQFVRVELLNPAGHWVALSNPVVLLPYWPESWPAGRVAFDWRGVRLAGPSAVDPRLRIEDARVNPNGGLELSGVVTMDGAQLRLRGDALKTFELRGRAPENCRRDADGVVSIPLEPGPFQLGLGFNEPWSEASTAPLDALPVRKKLALAIDLGFAESEERYALRDFGEPFRGPMEIVHHRPVRQRPASFRLPLPANETVWVRLSTTGFWTARGRLEMEGQAIGTFDRVPSMTFEIPPQPEAGWRTFTLALDPPTPERAGQLLLRRIEMWRGRGVVDY